MVSVSSLQQPIVSNIEKQPVDCCPACHSVSYRKLFTVREHEYATTTDDEFIFVRCMDCNAWYLSPRPHESTLSIIYPPNYYAYVMDAGKQRSHKKSFMSGLIKKLFKLRINPLSKFVPLNTQTRWLEVGCGDGYVLEAMRETYGVNGVGLDLSEAAAAACRRKGFEAHASRFEDFHPSDTKKFDVVHSSHVIEHLTSPRDYMLKVYDLLKPGGICVFITPNTDTWEAKLFGKHWGGLHVPRHWTLLNHKGMNQLAEGTGLQWKATRFSTNGVFWGFSLHSFLLSILGRKVADFIVPSDHRIVNTDLFTFLRIASFTLCDAFNLLLFRKSANMMVIFQKPFENQ
jgi:SAM-dependent methyltransferase